MSTTDDSASKRLPVTAEVGGEGGSFADPTIQVATFEERLPKIGGEGGASSTAAHVAHRESTSARGSGTAADPNSGMIRYPTEPPSPRSATEGRRVRRVDWRAGIIGVAAGAGLAFALQRRRSRRDAD